LLLPPGPVSIPRGTIFFSVGTSVAEAVSDRATDEGCGKVLIGPSIEERSLAPRSILGAVQMSYGTDTSIQNFANGSTRTPSTTTSLSPR